MYYCNLYDFTTGDRKVIREHVKSKHYIKGGRQKGVVKRSEYTSDISENYRRE